MRRTGHKPGHDVTIAGGRINAVGNMSAYEYVINTFLSIAGDVNIEVAVVNNEVLDDNGNLTFEKFSFENYNELTKWLRINKNKYDIDSKHMLYFGTSTGFTIYVKSQGTN